MKDWVNTMRDGPSPTFPGRAGLKYLASANYVACTSRMIFHIDLDCFFVSVALRDRPDLIGKPVAITHSKGVSAGFSELASVSYAARECGLHNGMFVRDALKLCPNLICLPYLFDDYRTISKAIYTIVARYSLEIRAVSCDEMYVDCTKLFDEVRFPCDE
ncbi:UmuC domain-containing protein [Trichostrongylus colubriformis]|uniref:UmuC domain-containing protein n=1 Tax=Trichostrongylus colubriformis TaxID=6319 RepID=A0AAN8ICZ0_TRICO